MFKPSVYVKVVGFRDVERHALNTLFRLSADRVISFGLWTPEASIAPQLALIDLESYEAGPVLAWAGHYPGMSLICVGRGAHANASRTFQRPLDWPAIIEAMDELFTRPPKLDDGIDFEALTSTIGAPLALKKCLLVDPSRESRMYLRARLSLAGHIMVDEVPTGAQAVELTKKRPYDLVFVSLDLTDMEGWALVQHLLAQDPNLGCVIVTSHDKDPQLRDYAEQCGCFGLLEKPYDPTQVAGMLQKI